MKKVVSFILAISLLVVGTIVFSYSKGLSAANNAANSIKALTLSGEKQSTGKQGKASSSTSNNSSFVNKPKITIDGVNASNEWTNLKIADGQGNLKELYAFKDNEKLYIMALGKSLNGKDNYIYINTDNDTSTGYKNWGQYGDNGAGAEYMLMSDKNGDWKMYKYVGPDWKWENTGVKTGSAVKDSNGTQCLELSINLSYFASAKKDLHISMGLKDDTGFAPKIWVNLPYAKVMDFADNDIDEDGKTNEWNSITGKGSDGTSTLKLSVAQDANKLYTIVEGSKLNTQNEYYLDVKEGGYQYGNYSGIEYVVKGNYVYPVIGNNKLDSSKKSAVYMDYQDNAVTMQLKLSQIGNPAAGQISIAYLGKSKHRLPQNGEKLKVTSVWKTKAEENTFYPVEDYTPKANPYKGWVAWASNGNRDESKTQEVKMAYFDIKWSELEPVEGKYDFEGVEKKYNFDYWRKKGVKLNLRFVMDNPTKDPNHMDIPKWLYDKLVKENYNGEQGGKWYNSPEIGAGFAPNYNSPTLIAAHEKAIKALAKRYDDPSIIAFVQIGSLGHWAEFHNWPEKVSGKFPNLSVSDKYVQHYIDNFKNVKMGMRKPFPIAKNKNLGLFNDVFGMKDSTDEFIDWTVNGWDEIGSYVDAASGFSNAKEAQKASAMPDFWKSNYSGGEFANGNAKLYISDDTIMETIRQIRASHTSWLGPCSPADYLKTDSESYQCNIDALLNIMGYNFVLESVTHDRNAKVGSKLNIKMQWNNKGVAPFYYKWPLELSLADSNGNIVAQTITSEDITKWLPGVTKTEQSIDIPKNLKAGTYTLCVAIIDPSTGKPGIKLSIEGMRSDGRYALDTIKITE